MDLKIKDDHRLNVLKNMTASEIKEKYKKRNELWGSLLAVYEQEGHKENVIVKENVTEIEEVIVDELEEWTMKNPNSIRNSPAQTQLAVTNPKLLSAAFFSANADFLSESEFEKKQGIHKKKKTNEKKEQKNGSNIHKSYLCKSSYVKTKKKFSSVRNCNKLILSSQKEELSVSLMKRKIENSKTKYLKKLQQNLGRKAEDPEVCVEKRIIKQKLIRLKKSKETIRDIKVPKSSTEFEKIKLKAEKINSLNHKCKLEYRYYLNTNNSCTRLDKRVFNCKLVFKVCHCFESDVEL